MKEVFIGDPTKEEICLYLELNEYSLLRKSNLRTDILSIRKTPQIKNTIFFQEIFPDTKGSLLQEKTNQPLSFLYEKRRVEAIPREKEIHAPELSKVCIKALRKLTLKNTQKNTGYKHVKLHYRSRKILFGKTDFPSNQVHSGKVKWGMNPVSIPHNANGVSPILKRTQKHFKHNGPKQKVKILIEARAFAPSFEVTEFRYKLNK